MKGLVIGNNVAEEVTLSTEATIHFETMHAITYNRVKFMIETLHTVHGYHSKVAGIANILPLPISRGIHGLLWTIQKNDPVEYKELQALSTLLGIKIEPNQWGYYSFRRLEIGDKLHYPETDRAVYKITQRAMNIIKIKPRHNTLTPQELDFRHQLLVAIENREPFTFNAVGD